MMESIFPEVEFEHEDFDFDTMDQELRVNERCQSLLESFYHYLLARGDDPQVASDLAYCADHYLRDYLVDFARQNVVRPVPGVVRRFAATWFITRTLEPEMGVLERHLKAIGELYGFLRQQHFISREELAWLEEEASLTEYYRHRLESFLALRGNGYEEWEAECPLKE
jgi:hypothetical protein